ncbi:MAG: asparagine synthase-related protein, partial [SAR202 cluster bacterium]|nr:asparagine synthase-related protein [SAR202 cluster bacterium]
MGNYNCMINPSSLVNTLTLRYDPSIKPNLPKKTWKDFEAINESPNIGFIEKSICNIIDQKLKKFDNQKISIALSGGIDSTLILSLIRKINPQIDIEAVSIKFADSIDETTAASKIAETFDTNHNIVYLENYLSELPKAISMINLPFWDLHWYYVVKKSQTLSKILISGDGGDELFGGYKHYKSVLLLNQIHKFFPTILNNFISKTADNLLPIGFKARHWIKLLSINPSKNLPIVPITDLVVKENDLVVATQGRSFWILDDLTPLHQLTNKV